MKHVKKMSAVKAQTDCFAGLVEDLTAAIEVALDDFLACLMPDKECPCKNDEV